MVETDALSYFPNREQLVESFKARTPAGPVLTPEDVAGAVLVVSQFTLYGDVRKGRRPSFSSAAPPELAERLYEEVVAQLRAAGLPVATGRFRASMNVRCEVDGPVTIQVDSRRLY